MVNFGIAGFSITINTLIFGKIKYVKDEIVTSTGFTNATPQRMVLFIDRVTGYSNGFEGVITKVTKQAENIRNKFKVTVVIS